MGGPADQNRQMEAWRGDFGDAYSERNAPSESAIAARKLMWTRILAPLAPEPPQSILEIGANVGLNLRALRELTDARLIAVEPNASARARLVADGVVPKADVHDGSGAQVPLPDRAAELVFTSGVLIHVPPDSLTETCAEIHRVADKYIACCEYFADRPQEVSYRGLSGMLFKRDFGDFWMQNHPGLTLVDYGFLWKRATGLDNLTWWLFRKG